MQSFECGRLFVSVPQHQHCEHVQSERMRYNLPISRLQSSADRNVRTAGNTDVCSGVAGGEGDTYR